MKSPHQFYIERAELLIENTMDKMKIKQRMSDSDMEDFNAEVGSGIGTHLAPTNRKRRISDGSATSATYQRCNICKGTNKSKFICSTCRQHLEKEVFMSS